MDALSMAERSLERHAQALDRLADRLRRAAPPADSPTGRAWSEGDMDGRIRAMRREARYARRAIGRIHDARRRHAPQAAPSDEAPAREPHAA